MPSLTIGITFALIGAILLWINHDIVKSGTRSFHRINHDMKMSGNTYKTAPLPQKYILLLSGGIFTLVGAMFTILAMTFLPEGKKAGALIASVFTLILGMVIFMIFVVNRIGVDDKKLISDDEELIKKEANIGNLIGVIVACIVLGFFSLTGLLTVSSGKYLIGSIITLVFGGLMGGLIFLYKKKAGLEIVLKYQKRKNLGEYIVPCIFFMCKF